MRLAVDLRGFAILILILFLVEEENNVENVAQSEKYLLNSQ